MLRTGTNFSQMSETDHYKKRLTQVISAKGCHICYQGTGCPNFDLRYRIHFSSFILFNQEKKVNFCCLPAIESPFWSKDKKTIKMGAFLNKRADCNHLQYQTETNTFQSNR